MERTPFYPYHVAFGAKLVEFGGFEMPVQYAGIIEEHMAVRKAAGLFDVSHMGEFEISGPDALAFIQHVTINDAAVLEKGRVQYSALCYPEGGIIDDLLVYNLGDRYMMVVNAANLKKDWDWLVTHKTGNVTLIDRSAETALLALQGPRSAEILGALTDAPLGGLAYYHAVEGKVAGVPALISRTGYTGELGYELYFAAEPKAVETVWTALVKAGQPAGMQPIGLGARDTLRLEMGFCLYGNDIDKTTNPLEAGLGWITKLNKGAFIGKDAIAAAKAAGIQRKLVGFTLPGRTIARHGYEIMSGGSRIGTVTSGTYSPVLECGIGMGYVAGAHAAPGSVVQVNIRGREAAATVVKIPFIQKP